VITGRADDDRDRELDRLLLGSSQSLPPTAGTWEGIRRRARRRRWARAGVVALSGAAVVAGIVPAVLAARGPSDAQRLSISDSLPQTVTVDGDAGSLRGFVPRSVSFVTQTEGFAWGSRTPDGAGVVAQTLDGGASWQRLAAPPIDATAPDDSGDGAIRFSNGVQGYVFGSSYFVTADGGQSWRQLPSPGHIDALETMNGRIWALVSACQTCSPVRVYSATTADPRLSPVSGVPELHGHTTSLAANGSSVDVLVGDRDFWASPNGRRWFRGVNPCAAHAPADSANVIASWNLRDVVTVCSGVRNGDSQPKYAYVSTNFGRRWAAQPASPSTQGISLAVTAGNGADYLLGVSRGVASVSHDGARRWRPAQPRGIHIGYAGFISPIDVVAIPSPADPVGAFLYSHDAGRSWTVTRFPS
jgi:photosystem II stability/assembly factor-like uncharacterized protein